MKLTGILTKNERLSVDIFRWRVTCPQLAEAAKVGQFVNISCGDAWNAWLRRPISICDVDKIAGIVDIVFQVRGAGTQHMSVFPEGCTVDLMGPLGNTFSTTPKGRIAVVGGGIGIFPLLFLLKQFKREQTSCYLGFRSKEHIVMQEEFSAASGYLSLSTDDGSAGHHGLVTLPFIQDLHEKGFERVYTCGPLAMMRHVAKSCEAAGVLCEVSMEQRMGCGVGACLVCACKTRETADMDWTYKHVCKDGPIFDSRTMDLG